jgi:hypothetical protein
MITVRVCATLVSVPGTKSWNLCSRVTVYRLGRTTWTMSAKPISRHSQPAATGTQVCWVRRSGGRTTCWDAAAGGAALFADSPALDDFSSASDIRVTP